MAAQFSLVLDSTIAIFAQELGWDVFQEGRDFTIRKTFESVETAKRECEEMMDVVCNVPGTWVRVKIKTCIATERLTYFIDLVQEIKDIAA